MKKNILKYSDFLVESIKDNMPDCGWKEITSSDYWTSVLRTEKFTEWIFLSKHNIPTN